MLFHVAFCKCRLAVGEVCCQRIIMKAVLLWIWISTPDKALLITHKISLSTRCDVRGLRPPDPTMSASHPRHSFLLGSSDLQS